MSNEAAARLAVVALSALLLAGCASVPAAAPNPSPKATTYPGQTASAIAAMIKGCSEVTPGEIGKGGPALVSTASCMLEGRIVDVNSWSSVSEADGVRGVFEANKAEVYYAIGNGWTVTTRDNPQLQYQFTNDGGKLFEMAMKGDPVPPADIPGEKSTAELVVKSIGGKVAHYEP